MTELTKEILDKLAEPFPADIIEFKPGATNNPKTKALALAYVEVRHYFDRLNEVVGPDWSDEYQFINPSGELVSCGLTICGVTRWDIGEKETSNQNTATSALAQSFKRACVKFGLGRHLYAIEKMWVPYDKERKQFTSQAFAQLRRMVSGEAPKPQAASWQPATKGETDDPNQEPEPSAGNGRKVPAKPKSRANGNKSTGPNDLLAAVDAKIDGSYGNIADLMLGIQAELGDGWKWPAANDADGWAEAKEAAIKHAVEAA